jgi:hypothetical protein
MAGKLIGEGRPIRFCPECRQADDHPRHRIATEPDDLARHMDCCAARGCPDGRCDVALVGAGGKTGAALLEHLLDRGDTSKQLAAHRRANPHQDPEHPAFAGWPETARGTAATLLGVDR